MATQSLCSIPGCDKRARTRGWCAAHWERWHRNGDPLGGCPSPGYAARFYQDVVSSYDGDDCLTWPYNRNHSGYGMMKCEGKSHSVHRLLCERAYGPPPTPEHHAAHICGNGHLGCVNRRHLRWATPSENMQDKNIHGTHMRGIRNPLVKLTETEVREIRSLAGAESIRKAAKRYGVTPALISQIRRRMIWRWLD